MTDSPWYRFRQFDRTASFQRLKTQGLQKDRRKNKLKKINTMYEYKYILKLSLSAIFVFSFRQLSLFQDR